MSTSDGSHSLKLYFSRYNCPLSFYPFMRKFFHDVDIFEVFCDSITPEHLYPFSGSGQSISLDHWIFSGALIIPSSLWSSWVLIICSVLTPQTISSTDVKWYIILLDAGYVCLKPFHAPVMHVLVAGGWGFFTFIFVASKHDFFLQCSSNSWASVFF